MYLELIPIAHSKVFDYPFDDLNLSEFPWKAYYNKIREEYSKELFAIKVEDKIVGGMLLKYEKDELPELTFFEVDPIYRGHGYGKGALDRLIDILKDRGFKKLFVQTGRPEIYDNLGYKFEKVEKRGLIIDLFHPSKSNFKNSFFSIIYSDKYLIHNNPSNPEIGERISRTIEFLKVKKLTRFINIIQPIEASEEDILKIHSNELLEKVRHASESESCLGENNCVCKDTFYVSKLAFGGALLAGKLVEKYKKIFVLSRPPGHHASKNEAKGFCFFNNIAGLAIHLYEKGYKPMIIDWDAHHGDGTQEILYDKPIMYVSFHQKYLYPYTGSESEIGVGKGKGFNKNFPLLPLTEDKEYLEIFKNVYNIAQDYKPDVLLISAGQDAHKDEKTTGLLLSSSAFYKMSQIVNEISETYANGRLIFILEGGYNLKALAESNYMIVKAILDSNHKN